VGNTLTNDQILRLAAKDIVVKQNSFYTTNLSEASWNKLVSESEEMLCDLDIDTFFSIINSYKDHN